jgi:hypothetical protein
LPDLKVVSERPAEEIKKQKATAALGHTLRTLTANLLRTVRGAGKPEMIFEHVDHFVKAFARFCDDNGQPPDATLLRELIALPQPNWNHNDDRLQEAIGEHSICQNSLQIVASALLDQQTQREKAVDDLRDTLRIIEGQRALAKKRKRQVQKRGKRPR